jgi:hypothetical protein
MKILRTPNAGGKWIAVQRGLLERATLALRPPGSKPTAALGPTRRLAAEGGNAARCG